MISRALEAWDYFWFPSGPPHALAVVRIALGLCSIIFWLRFLFDVELLFSGDGLYAPRAPLPEEGVQSLKDFLGLFLGNPSDLQAWVCYLLMLVTLLGFTAGLWFRLSTSLYMALFVYHYFIFGYANYGSYDKTLLILTLLLWISPCSQVWSLDASMSELVGQDPPETVSLWTQRLICVQLSIWYFGTGVYKLLSDAWSGGEVLYHSLIGVWGTPVAFWIAGLGFPMWFWDIVVMGVIWFEILAGFLLFSRRFQVPVMVFAALFHFMNGVLFNIWQFLFFPIIYILYFPPEEVKEWIESRLGLVTNNPTAPEQAPE